MFILLWFLILVWTRFFLQNFTSFFPAHSTKLRVTDHQKGEIERKKNPNRMQKFSKSYFCWDCIKNKVQLSPKMSTTNLRSHVETLSSGKNKQKKKKNWIKFRSATCYIYLESTPLGMKMRINGSRLSTRSNPTNIKSHSNEKEKLLRRSMWK